MLYSDKLEAELKLKTLQVKCHVVREAVKGKLAMQREEIFKF